MKSIKRKEKKRNGKTRRYSREAFSLPPNKPTVPGTLLVVFALWKQVTQPLSLAMDDPHGKHGSPARTPTLWGPALWSSSGSGRGEMYSGLSYPFRNLVSV